MQNCRQVTKEGEKRKENEAHMHPQHQTPGGHGSHRARVAACLVVGQQGAGNAGLSGAMVMRRLRVEETAGAEAEARHPLDAQRGLVARLQGRAAAHDRLAQDGTAGAGRVGHGRRQQRRPLLGLGIHRGTHRTLCIGSSSSGKGLFLVSGRQHQRAERNTVFALGGGEAARRHRRPP